MIKINNINTDFSYGIIDTCTNYKLRRIDNIVMEIENDEVVVKSDIWQSYEALYISIITIEEFKENLKEFQINNKKFNLIDKLTTEEFELLIKDFDFLNIKLKFNNKENAENSTAYIFYKKESTISDKQSLQNVLENSIEL